jgi:hypothetical protein
VRNTTFRIDCETPGATIKYAWWNKGTAVIPDTPTAGGTWLNNTDRYRDGYNAVKDEVTNPAWTDPNSKTSDATAGELVGIITANSGATGASTVPATRVGNDDSLYTSRKDYIAAEATRTGLADSAPGYEGAFKTVIVYRDPPENNNRRYVKIEAVDQANGAVKIAGFPMKYNDMLGLSSKHLYQVPNADRQNPPNARDWVFISWEIVTNFWHVGMLVVNQNPNSPLQYIDGGNNPWADWEGDWYKHNFRRYGNCGLRIGNQ